MPVESIGGSAYGEPVDDVRPRHSQHGDRRVLSLEKEVNNMPAKKKAAKKATKKTAKKSAKKK